MTKPVVRKGSRERRDGPILCAQCKKFRRMSPGCLACTTMRSVRALRPHDKAKAGR